MVNRLHKQATAEALGTAGLVLAVVGGGHLVGGLGATRAEAAVATTLAVVAAFVAVLYAIGPLTGGHINPAVSWSMFVTGRIPARQLGYYVLGQVLGGAVGAAVANAVWSQPLATVGEATASGQSLVAEAIAAFALVALIHGAVNGGNVAALPLLIPAVIAGASLAAPLGIANPAVAVATSLIGGGASPATMVLLVVIELAAGTAAGLTMRFLYSPGVQAGSDEAEAPAVAA